MIEINPMMLFYERILFIALILMAFILGRAYQILKIIVKHPELLKKKGE